MKALMIFGAMVGFMIGCGSGLAGRSSWGTALWRAAAGALVAALLTRWWIQVWLQGLRESINQRQASRPASTPNLKAAARS